MADTDTCCDPGAQTETGRDYQDIFLELFSELDCNSLSILCLHFNSGNYPFRSFNHFIQLAAHIICTLLTIQYFYRALFLVHTSYSSYSLPSLYSLRVSVFCICANMAISAKSPPPLYSVSDADGLVYSIVWAGDHIVIFKYLLPAHNKQPYITPADILILPGIITLPSFFSHYCTF